MTNFQKGVNFQIKSYKHNARFHREWKNNILLDHDEDRLIGVNYKTDVIEADFTVWKTSQLALFYFHTYYWFNIIKIFDEEKPYFYCNLSSPYTLERNSLTYVDYDIDLIVKDDFSYKIVDEDEYQVNKALMGYSDEVEMNVMTHLNILENWIKKRKGPFEAGFVDHWHSVYKDMV